MGRIEEMRSLTEHLVQAHKDRTEALEPLAAETASQLAGFHADRAEMAAEQRERLREALEPLAPETASQLAGFHAARAEMAAEQRERLMEGRRQLASETAAMSEELHEETLGVAEAWRQMAAPITRERLGGGEKQRPARSHTDDLTAIQGIGPTTQKRLLTGGIRTFSQLAKASPERVKKIIGPGSRAGVKEWIARAGALAGTG